MKKILSLILFLSFTAIFNSEVNAQFVDIGTGTVTNGTTTAAPINIWYRSMHYQVVYTAAELTASGALPGDTIYELGWYVTGAPLNDLPNYTLKLKHTAAANSSVYDGIGLNTVATIPLHAPTAGGYDMTAFSTVFVWNGTSNLLVDVCFDQVNPSYNASGQVRTFGGASRYIRSDGSSQCGNATTANLTTRAQVRLKMSGGTPPPCTPPSMLTSTNIWADSVALNWNPGAALLFTAEVGLPGFTPGTGTEIASTFGTNSSEILSGLASSTYYDAYVIGICPTGDTLLPIGPYTFITAFQTPDGVVCNTGSPSIIFSEDFENDPPVGWTGPFTGFGGQWDITPGNSNSTNTGPFVSHSGSNHLEFESSTFTSASVISPAIDLSSSYDEVELSFWMHAYGAEMGTFSINISNSLSGPFTTIFTFTGQYQTADTDPFVNIAVDLTPYLGQTIYLELANSATAGFHNDMSIDLMEITSCVSCPAPTNVMVSSVTSTSADITWNSGGAAAWEVEYGPAGFTPGSGATVTASNPLSLTGLNPATVYEFYLRDYCGIGDLSLLVGPTEFSTACDTFVAPYYQNFDFTTDNTTIPPLCWDNSFGSENWRFRNSVSGVGVAPGYGVANSPDHTTGTGNFTWIDASGGIGTNGLETLPIDFSGLTQGIVGCWILSNNTNNGAQNELSIEAFDGTAWVSLITYLGNAPGWVRVYATIPASIPTTTTFRLVQIESSTGLGNAFNNDLLIDDFFVEEAPTCLNSINLSDTILTPTTVELSWDVVGSASYWIIEYGAPGFVPGTNTGTQITTTSNPVVLTLPSSTDFDWYVVDSCGPGDVSWYSYQDNFRMPGLVVCDTSNNFTYCHPDESIETFTYQSENGTSLLHFVFNSGIIGNFVDFTIYDGPDNTYPVLYSTTGGANMAGVEFTSSSSFVAFEWNSQFANVCNTPIDFDVNCCDNTTSQQDIFICVDSSYMLADSVVVSSPGGYTAVIPNALGCDSTISYFVLELPDTTNVSDEICNGDVYVFADGSSTNVAGMFQATVPNKNGCDSTINYAIDLLMPSTSNMSASICQGEVYILPDGSTVSTAGNHNATLTNAVGCDSIITVNLIINLNTSESVNVQICEGEMHDLPDGVSVSAAGTYSSTINNVLGCDSVVTTNLTVATASFSDVVIEICGTETYTLLNGDIVDETGEYNVNVENAAGCDSIVTVYISKCNAIGDLDGEGILSIYPNPASTSVNIVLNDLVINNDVELKIINSLGQTIYDAQNVENSSLNINVEDFSAGMYFIVLSDKNSSSLHKFMISK